MSQTKRGSCLCGAVRFRTHGALRGVVYCHCSQCRRQSGHFYAATDVDDACLEIEGPDNLTWYAASDFAKRGFCRTCGSALFWKRNGADRTSVMAGSFDQPSGLKPEAHIFVDDKGDYYEIADGLPQYARSTDSVPVAG
ncbi:GFA family protein [Chelativorans intermedius]|uniref:GFA family protein n=1 Tax=Chelativorans intermedius TaxID=515947 RepID=A0ABV6DAC9_9HYPH|nr:GFA family protein [Chelativorans intermedius]MCT9000083.1 GFA family protein [Chelativorans intermedius]